MHCRGRPNNSNNSLVHKDMFKKFVFTNNNNLVEGATIYYMAWLHQQSKENYLNMRNDLFPQFHYYTQTSAPFRDRRETLLYTKLRGLTWGCVVPSVPSRWVSDLAFSPAGTCAPLTLCCVLSQGWCSSVPALSWSDADSAVCLGMTGYLLSYSLVELNKKRCSSAHHCMWWQSHDHAYVN